ncbi:MAG: hypothetical protein PW790_06225 [Parvibaculaceae bacterium]|nr:hypothetical protein [Parvibaculaceae bacterium]
MLAALVVMALSLRPMMAWGVIAPVNDGLDEARLAQADSDENLPDIVARLNQATDISSRSWMLQRYYSLALVAQFRKTGETRDIVQAMDVVKKALAAAPARSQLWILLAMEQSMAGRPIDDVITSVRQSYLTGPHESYLSRQRAGLIFSNWHRMPADLRAQAVSDAVELSSIAQIEAVYDFAFLFESLAPEPRKLVADQALPTPARLQWYSTLLKRMRDTR